MNFYAEAIWRDVKRNAAAFWYHPTIKAMHAQMLREVQRKWFEKRGGNCAVIFGEGVKTQYIWLTNADFERPRDDDLLDYENWPWRILRE